MKLRILNYRVTASHDLISNLSAMKDAVSASDSHAFVYDSAGLRGDSHYSSLDVQRRQMELRELLHRKGGIVVCILRPEASTDTFLDLAAPTLRISYAALQGKVSAHSSRPCSR